MKTSLAMILSLALSAAGAAPPPAGPSSGFVQVDKGRLFYESAGAGPAVVLVHDGLLHRETWDAQVEPLARAHRVVRYDRRGYGRSDPPREPWSNHEDLLAVFDQLGIDKAVLVGCSYGGLLSTDFSVLHPERVRALVLVGPIVSGLGFSDHFTRRGDRGNPPPESPVEQRIEYYVSRDPWLVAPESAAAKRRLRELLTANPRNLAIPWDLLRGPKLPTLGRLPEIRIPVLILVGESDVPDVHAHAGALQAGITGSRRVVMIGSGHLPHLERPEEFNRLVLDFLGGLP